MSFINHADIETNTRVGFIKVCHILAKGLSFPNDRPLIISITGQMDVGKALLADAMINALDERLSNKKYNVPFDVKMAFELSPGHASHIPVHGYIEMDGKDEPIHFIRNLGDLRRAQKKEETGLIFYSDRNPLPDSDLLVDITTHIKDRDGSVIRNNWSRFWSITVLRSSLYNEKMSKMLEHLDSIRARQLYKKSLDI